MTLGILLAVCGMEHDRDVKPHGSFNKKGKKMVAFSPIPNVYVSGCQVWQLVWTS